MTAGPSRREVQEWLEAVREEQMRLHERLGPMLVEQQRLQDREGLLKELLNSLEVGEGAAIAAPRDSESANGSGRVGTYVAEKASEILRDAGKAVHINDLHAEFLKRGFQVPGAGRQVNLIVHLRKAPGITSPRRGFYELGERTDAGGRRRRG